MSAWERVWSSKVYALQQQINRVLARLDISHAICDDFQQHGLDRSMIEGHSVDKPRSRRLSRTGTHACQSKRHDVVFFDTERIPPCGGRSSIKS